MKEGLFEKRNDMQEAPKENGDYQRYRECGGIINEKDYENALLRARNSAVFDTDRIKKSGLIKQAELIAGFAGIELHNTKDAVDQKVVLYGILRNDVKPENIVHHHSQMSDQRLFAEVLRMLGDVDSLHKLIAAYPNIPFD